ncbi:MAG TPA: porin [Bacteroidales bacterium]|nr:porin [Bacteroidales bacterium]
MKKTLITRTILTVALLVISVSGLKVSGQSINDVLNLLVANKSLTQQQADSIRADAAIKQQEADASKKSFPVNTSRLIQLSGYTQVRYQRTEEKGKTSGFDIRRARLDLKGNISPYFSYGLQADFAGSPKLLDAYGDIKLAEYFFVTLGQFKIPLTYENQISDNKIEITDRSQVVEALVARSKDLLGNTNGRDIGIMAGGALLKINGQPLIEYRLGIFNGSGINVADTANSNKDFSGRLLVNPVKGLTIGGSFYNGFDKVNKPDVAGKAQTRDRFGFELNYSLPRLLIRGEYLKGKDGKTTRDGWYLLAGYYVIKQKLQLLGRYDTYNPNTSKTGVITNNYTFGGNYNFNNWSRLQLFYTVRSEVGTSVKNNYLTVQYQVGF